MKACSEVCKNENGGVALILVIWVLVILIAISGEFSYSIRTELTTTRNFKEEEEAYHGALAGIELGKLEILTLKEPFHVYHNEEGSLIFHEEDDPPVRKGELGNSSFSYTLIDESGKLNINTASEEQLKNLLKNIGVETADIDTIVDSILDWKDENDLHRLNGAEEDYYRGLENPYSSKDGPFDIIDELLLVKGITPEIFFTAGEENEEEQDEEGEGEKMDRGRAVEAKTGGLSKYLTTWGSKKININTAPPEVLEAVLGTARAELIVNQRESGPLYTAQAGGMVTSTIFTILSTGTNRDGSISRTIQTTIRKFGDRIEVLYWNDNFIG